MALLLVTLVTLVVCAQDAEVAQNTDSNVYDAMAQQVSDEGGVTAQNMQQAEQPTEEK